MRYLILVLAFTSCAMPKQLKVAPVVANNLEFLYERMPTEFAFCAYGDWTGTQINIRRIDIPLIYLATPSSVHYEPCEGQDFLGIGHSHPAGSQCLFSDMDVFSLIHSKAPFGFLVCEDSKIVWYSKNAVRKQVKEMIHAGSLPALFYSGK